MAWVLVPEATNPASEFGFFSSEFGGIDGAQPEVLIVLGASPSESPAPTSTISPDETPTATEEGTEPQPTATSTSTVPVAGDATIEGTVKIDTYISEWEPDVNYGGTGASARAQPRLGHRAPSAPVVAT